MKTILVPTDFSPAANNAAKYAFAIAETAKANIKLCNAVKIPAESIYAAQVTWPLEDIGSLKDGSEAELNYLANVLEKEHNPNNGFMPHIARSTGIGDVTDYIRNIVLDDELNMVVMGMSGANLFSKLVLGSNSRDLIEKAEFPLLLVPKNYTYTPIRKIAFATDLSDTDIDTLHSVANFARYFNAQILLSHVIQSSGQDQKAIDAFLSEVTCKINYPNVYYRSLQSEGVSAGLNQLAENSQIDLLVMIHRSHGIFSSGYTQKLATHTKVPLLVLPDGFNNVLM